jgi:cytochrome c556
VHGQVSRFMSAAAVAAAIVLGTPDGASAQAAGGNQQAPASPAIVAYRKALMNSNTQHMNALRALVSADVDLPDQIKLHARALADNGKLVSTQSASADYDMFPPGSTHATSRATEAIWADRPGFSERVRAFQTATAALNEIAQRGGTKEQITTALTPVQQSCGGCHMAFRGPAPQTGQQ